MSEGDTVPTGGPLISIGGAVAAQTDQIIPVEPSAAPAPGPTPAATAGSDEAEDDPYARPADAPLILVGTAPKEAVPRRVHVRRPVELSDRPVTRTRGSGSLRTDERDETRVPITGVRKVIAETMVRSAFTAPHAAMWTSVDVTATMRLVDRLKRDREWAGVRVTALLFIARTLALAVKQFPEINASWDEASGEIVRHRALNLGVAVATPRGLMVPNVKDAASTQLRDLAAALEDLATRGRAGRLQPSDMSDGTLTITNVGTFGVEGATPILNPPEAAILALGAIEPRPWVVDGTVHVREVMTLSISIDHRLVDGELGAKVLRHMSRLLNEPGLALL